MLMINIRKKEIILSSTKRFVQLSVQPNLSFAVSLVETDNHVAHNKCVSQFAFYVRFPRQFLAEPNSTTTTKTGQQQKKNSFWIGLKTTATSRLNKLVNFIWHDYLVYFFVCSTVVGVCVCLILRVAMCESASFCIT